MGEEPLSKVEAAYTHKQTPVVTSFAKHMATYSGQAKGKEREEK